METPSENPPPSPRRSVALRAVAVGLSVFVVLLATSPGLPIAWDEGNAIGRAAWIADWGRSWFQAHPDGKYPLSREAISDHWRYTTQVEGHPAFYGIVIAAGHSIGARILPHLTAWRFGPILLFSLAAGAMFYRLSRDYSQPAGLAAVLALLLQPRLFAHAHFATCDSPLMACWILAWAAFPVCVSLSRKREQDPLEVTGLAGEEAEVGRGQLKRGTGTSPRHLFCRFRLFLVGASPRFQLPTRFWLTTILFGIFLGMTMSTKATGWIAPLPFLAWTAVYRDRRSLLALAVGLPTALATFYLLNPPLWHEPIRGLATFFHLNMSRQLNVANFFLGRMYDLHHSLPWYNTAVWTAIVVPVGLLALALVGLASILRRGLADRAGILLMFNWLILLIVRALPHTPPHDGIRLFLPAFAFLAAIIGVGVGAVFKKTSTTENDPESKRAKVGLPSRARRSLQIAVVLIYLGSATSLFWYAPQWLSYYNLAIGGLPGATRAGMEPTYYWDSLDQEVLDWLKANTDENEKVLFGSGATESLIAMHLWGTLPVEFCADDPGRYRWYVIQRRPSACMPPDQWLLRNAQPVYKKYLHRYGRGPWQLNVPLLEIYRYEDYATALREIRRSETGETGERM